MSLHHSNWINRFYRFHWVDYTFARDPWFYLYHHLWICTGCSCLNILWIHFSVSNFHTYKSFLAIRIFSVGCFLVAAVSPNWFHLFHLFHFNSWFQEYLSILKDFLHIKLFICLAYLIQSILEAWDLFVFNYVNILRSRNLMVFYTSFKAYYCCIYISHRCLKISQHLHYPKFSQTLRELSMHFKVHFTFYLNLLHYYFIKFVKIEHF